MTTEQIERKVTTLLRRAEKENPDVAKNTIAVVDRWMTLLENKSFQAIREQAQK